MSYIDSNKKAWEEAFEKRRDGWGDDLVSRLSQEEPLILNETLRSEIS